jgi:SAM-dependent methyltransferase
MGDFPHEAFDLVHARCLFEHLTERDTLLGKAIGWLAPGGWLVITDNATFPAHASARPVMGRLAGAVERLLSATIGTDFTWAPRLPVLLVRAGLVDVDLSIRTEVLHGGPGEGSTRVTTVRLLPELVGRGLLGAEDADAVRELFADPSFVDLSVASISAWGRRPLT